jgi:GxxExxY protein
MNAIKSEGPQGYTENQLSKIIFDCTLRVHRALGPGLLESSYEECLFYELLRQDYKL